MIRSEATPDLLIATILNQFGECREWEGSLRVKWILNSATTTQMNEDELLLLVIREKNKTL